MTLPQIKAALDAMRLGVTVTDVDDTIIYTNPANATMHGFSVEELIGKSSEILFAIPKQRPRTLRQMSKLDSPWMGNTLNLRKDATTFPVHLVSDVVSGPSGPVALVITSEEILPTSDDGDTERAIQLASAAAIHDDGLWNWNLQSNTIYYSSRWKEMLGYEDDEVAESPQEWLDRVHPDDRSRLQAELAAHFEGTTPHFQSEHRVIHKDGSYRRMLTRGSAIRNGPGRAISIAGSQIDLKKNTPDMPQLLEDSLHDTVTGLPSRARLLDLVERAIVRAKRLPDRLFAILVLNVDRFSVINDILGYDTGNDLLAAIAKRLEPCFRTTDTFVRLGGDEFGVLLEDMADISDATRVSNRINDQLSVPFDLKGRSVFTSVSIGIAVGMATYTQPEALLRDANLALHRAKSKGPGGYQVFDTAMHHKVSARLQLETDLRWALERGEFRTYYQPIVTLATGQINGVEALVRWQHPKHGLLLPAAFLHVAEETGMIVPMGWTVLDDACRHIREWQGQCQPDHQMTLSVNLSGKQLSEPDAASRIGNILRDTGTQACQLTLEMTETAIMDDIEAMSAALSQLKDLELQLHLDDFGTGYASLSHLHRFPVDTIKIDRSFVSNMGIRPGSTEIVSAITALAKNLGLGVIAEGVESAEQAEQLKALGCNYAQGFYFSKPVPADEVSAMVSEDRRLA